MTILKKSYTHKFDLKYGINPHQKPARIFSLENDNLPFSILNGRPSYTNILDAINAWFLVKELEQRNIKRSYRAIICGQLIAGGTIENKIGRHPTKRIKMAVTNKGKLATTHFKIIKKYQHYTYLNIQLGTGRTHQIRVHMNSIKHPIIGDPLYGKSISIKKGIHPSLRECIRNFKRQALHAYNLEFIHPTQKKMVSYKAELPDDMKNLIEALEIDE